MKNNKKTSKMTVLLFIVAGILCGGTVGAFFALTHDLPQIQALESFQPSAITKIYSSDHVVLAELYAEKREPAHLNQIPRYLKMGVVAVEDRRFYDHIGIDLKGILRAVVHDIIARRFVEGASTITQQLAKTLFLTPEKNLMRKIREALLALQLEKRYTKDEILTLYLNQIYFGSGAYGVRSAARIFFGKSLDRLTIAECALISAMPRSPSRYSPLVNPELSIRRRNIVLKQMRDVNLITQGIYETALKETLMLNQEQKSDRRAPYFVDYIKGLLEEQLGWNLLYKGGLRIDTTLSWEMQQAADHAVSENLDALSQRMAAKKINHDDLQAALIALDVKTGGILAMTGGRNYRKSPYNRAIKSQRQPGSAFKPFIYALAIESGYSQSDLILDAPVAFGKKKEWRPENYSKTYQGEITLRKALTKSANIPAIRLTETLTPSALVSFARRFGFQSHLTLNLSLALGTSEVALMELTSAYTVFPNQGYHVKPYGIRMVKGADGRMIFNHQEQKRIAISRVDAAIMVNMLEAVVMEGTGRRAKGIAPHLGGKTGTSDNFKDALFIGFSPSIAAGVWVGRDGFKTLGKGEGGSRAALPVWSAFMKEAVHTGMPDYFDIPDGVQKIRIHPDTGQPVAADSPFGVNALFKTKNQQ